MNRFWWCLADFAFRALEPEERDVVRGDLAESGEAGRPAFLDVFGLVVRRQCALWRNWHPWCVLVGLVLPFGVLFSFISRRTADGSAIYLWLYANNWDSSLWSNPGYRHELAHWVAVISMQYFTLFCWSWSSGFVLGYVSRRSLPFLSFVFFFFVLFVGFCGAPPRDGSNASVFELAFYRFILPLIVQVALVLGPSLWGLCRAEQVRDVRPFVRAMLWAAATASLPGIAIETGLASVPYLDQDVFRSIARVVAYWPVAYLVVAGIARHRNVKFIPAKQ